MVPKLRFGEFSSPWDKLNLEVVSSYIKGFAFKSQDYADQGERIIRVSDLLSDSIKTQNEKIYISKLKVDDLKKYKIKSGEIIITTVGSKPELRDSAVGRAIFVREDGIGYLNQNLLKLTANKGFNSAFIYMSISGNRYLSHIENIQRGNANQSNITVSDLLEFPLFCPNEDEQLKLGLFLTAVDDKISQLTKKHELLTLYKKGVMQKIFSQELRFKDDMGREFSDWNTITFYKVFTVSNLKELQVQSSKYLSSGSVPIVDQSNKKTAGWINSDITYKDLPVVIFGDHTRIVKWVDYEFRPGADGTQILKANDSFDPKFCYYTLTNIELPNLGYSRHLKELKEISFSVPSYINEQTKIANFLTAIDDKITNLKSQLEAAKEYKQGLLQQMFV